MNIAGSRYINCNLKSQEQCRALLIAGPWEFKSNNLEQSRRRCTVLVQKSNSNLVIQSLDWQFAAHRQWELLLYNISEFFECGSLAYKVSWNWFTGWFTKLPVPIFDFQITKKKKKKKTRPTKYQNSAIVNYSFVLFVLLYKVFIHAHGVIGARLLIMLLNNYHLVQNLYAIVDLKYELDFGSMAALSENGPWKHDFRSPRFIYINGEKM